MNGGEEMRNSFMGRYFDSKNKELDMEEVSYTVGMTALAAMLTTASIMINFIIAMCQFPEWQEALQKEIDSAVGNRLVEPADFPKLPILRAIIKELIRWRPIIPSSE